MVMRTFCAVNMNGARLWLAVGVMQALLLATSCGNHRRSMASQAALPSKGGWRPVVGSNGLIYNSFGTSPLHAPVHNYKIPVPVLDIQQYASPSSARPLTSRDGAKLTSIAQSYRPTTLRTVPTQQQLNQPISTYHNPFAVQSNGFPNNALSYYKQVQQYPLDSVLIRNPHNPFAARPVYQKYPQKFKQQLQNNVYQQLTNIQPIQFGQYQTAKPLDIFGKPLDNYVRPNDSKKQQQSNSGIETYKPEVFKLPDSDTASQSLSQQVKTAQQQNFGLQNQVYNTYPQYSYQDSVFPPSILSSFGSFGVQSLKGRDPLYPSTKPTFQPQQPQQPTKTTIFNSFNYPNYKSTPTLYTPTTTPKIQTTPNQIHYSSTYSDYKITPAPHTKISTPPKIDPNANIKDSFKPSPYDPFTKNHQQNDYNKVTTYNPIQTTANTVYEYNYQSQYNDPNYYNQQQTQQNVKYTQENKKQKIHDSIPAGGNQQVIKQYASPPRGDKDNTLNTQIRPTYEVTETTEADIITQSSPPPWQLTSQPYDSFKSHEESVINQDYSDYGRPNPTPLPDIPEEYAIVTEPEKGYQNSLGYDGQGESQSRRPLGDDFEPIGKHKLQNYYYKVSTPVNEDYSVPRRTKKPTESSKISSTAETTTPSTASSEPTTEPLPTLPPNKHFKRPSPSSPEPPTIDKDRIRKRNKIRRRRPVLANINRNKEETTSRFPTTKTAETTQVATDEPYTIKPRVRPTTNAKLQSQSTTPADTTDLTTSALPTISPTAPTIIKKKLIRRPLTTTPVDKAEATTITSFKVYEANKESPIMKIANRSPYPKPTPAVYEYKTDETPDYTHKQDEKDTPTSDVTVPDTLRTTVESDLEFAFHKDMKPIEAKLEPVTHRYRETTTDDDVSNEITTYAPRTENKSNTGKIQRPRLRNKYNRPKFSVKDYKNRLGSTTTTTEKTVESTQKVRFPLRRPFTDSTISETESTTERKKFTPKEVRTKINNTDSTQETYTVRQPGRLRQTTAEVENTTKISARIRNGNRRTKPTEEVTEPSLTTFNTRRPLRKKIPDSDIEESVQDITVTETVVPEQRDFTSERTRSESAIMKIADKKHHDHHLEHLFEHSKRVSDLTLAASKDYNKPGMFKTVATNSRRIPNYFTIATDDPILPIEAFFPQLNQKKES